MAGKFSKAYILGIFTQALKQGITPRKLAVTCALGMVMGVFPILGITTLFCLGLSILFRLNVAIIQLANYLMTALQILLVLPFIQLGTYLFGLKGFSYTRTQLVEMFQNDFWKLLKDSSATLAGGAGAWFIVSVPAFFILYFLFYFLFQRWRLTNPDRYTKEGK